ncbi:hypothetical protein [Dysosmobacter sp.]|uniref:hypothetical protein n=1 Tax=Dysosmobacter sp. TaxID=2591382 RepID=UPI002A8C89BD|nr:hypothetical protein [Dysosmobacter sp.]MDY3281661.1 hypothetical protein [Dysosmobacter sp.]
MHACSDYTIKLAGAEDEIKKATAVLAAAFQDESLMGKDCITIEGSYQFVWVQDVVKLAELMVRNAPDLSSLTISGTVDTSESAGEYMDFLIKYENGILSVQSSCWYLILHADEFDDYAEFSEVYQGYSEEEYEELRKCPHYILNSGNGDLVTEVPLDEPEVIDLDAASVYIEEEAAALSPVPVCRCECGNEVTLEQNDEIFLLYTGESMPVSCEKCGKKYKVFLK